MISGFITHSLEMNCFISYSIASLKFIAYKIAKTILLTKRVININQWILDSIPSIERLVITESVAYRWVTYRNTSRYIDYIVKHI